MQVQRINTTSLGVSNLFNGHSSNGTFVRAGISLYRPEVVRHTQLVLPAGTWIAAPIHPEIDKSKFYPRTNWGELGFMALIIGSLCTASRRRSLMIIDPDYDPNKGRYFFLNYHRSTAGSSLHKNLSLHDQLMIDSLSNYLLSMSSVLSSLFSIKHPTIFYSHDARISYRSFVV